MILSSLLAAVLLTVDPKPLARFDPQVSFGAAVDVQQEGASARVFTKDNVAAMLSAGFHRISYRLATELGGEAWHWNPQGTWSDPAREQGYWTSSDRSDVPIVASYGYRLPRRGNTIDQSGNDSYSRIDDGDLSTFWKSNPYLADRPQWLFADLGGPKAVRTIRIAWGDPFAIDFRVQHWSGVDPIDEPADGRWIDFTHGVVRGNRSRETMLTLSATAIQTRYVRVLMTRSSRSAPKGATDRRDREGFAVRELWIDDHVLHAPSRTGQSIVWVSSTDPWHRAIDIDRGMVQPGFDLVFGSGLTRGLPTLMPVSLLYGTPEDSAAELRFLRWRRYAVSQIEMGEEPDGQAISPEDYAALYGRWADALHEVDRTIALGGPAFQSTVDLVSS
ncbi:MAG: discoidin domain-containing protein, partial [Thermoanaerobaculia bacterium]